MGRWPNPASSYREFKGHVDEVSIWNRALSVVEIDSIMVNPESVTGVNYDAVGLISYWNFDDLTANDANSNQVDGVIHGINPFGTMPIHLTSFVGFENDQTVLLNWTTDSEVNNAYFEVQRSSNGVIWETITELTAAGNSNRPVSYTVEDYEPSAGMNYYRLKQVDFNGTFSFSNIAIVINSKNSEATNFMVYPNPVSDQLTIRNAEFARVILVNEFGRIIYDDYIPPGVHALNFENMQKGIFLLRAISENGSYSTKLIKQ